MAPLLLRRLAPPLDDETRQAALADPGPSWREWFYFDFARAWIVLLFFVVDSWVVAIFLIPLNLYGMVPSLIGAVYAEILAYRYLWARPRRDRSMLSGETFKPTWLTPVRWGRWTPEAWRVRAGLDPEPGRTGPDPREFL
jgi:hypothetical protein